MNRVALIVTSFFVGVVCTAVVFFVLDRPGVGQKVENDQVLAEQATLLPQDQIRYDLQLDLAAVVNDVRRRQGFEVDFYTMNDLISINQNVAAILDKASKDATHLELRQYAAQLKAQRENENKQFINWQRDWSYLHH